MKALYDYLGVSLEVLLVFMPCFSVMQWIRTFFVIPTRNVPDPLPDNYHLRRETFFAQLNCHKSKVDCQEMNLDQKSNDNTVDQYQTTCSWKAEVSHSPEIAKSYKHFKIFSLKMISFLSWYCVLSFRVNMYQAWFNSSLDWMFPNEFELQHTLTNIFGMTYMLSLITSPLVGFCIDYVANWYDKVRSDLNRGRKVGIAIVSATSSAGIALVSFLSIARGSPTIACMFPNLA